MVFVSQDYAISTDEPIHNEYGVAAYSYFRSSFADRTAIHFREGGAVPQHGVMFDLVCAAAERLSPLGRFQTRHLVTSVVGWLGMLYAARLAGALAGTAASCLTMLFLVLSPRYFGDSMNNPKDIPFASAHAAAVYYLTSARTEFPFFRPGELLKAVAAIGAAIEVRAGGIMLLGYFWIMLAARAAWARIREPRRALMVVALGGTASVAAILAGVAFWPWAQQKPFLRPFQALAILAHYDVAGNFRVLFDGAYYRADGLPRLYIPTWIAISVPVVVLVFAAASIPLIATVKRETALRVAFVWLTILVPVASAVVSRPILYDGMRHLLFVIPPLAALAGFAAARLWEAARSRRLLAFAFVAAIAAGLWDPLRFEIANHPFQMTYFNPLVGGVRGAFGRFDIDYWANTYGAAIRWLEKNVPGDGPIRVTGVKHPTRDVVPTYEEESARIRFAGVYKPPDADVSIEMTFGNAEAIAKVLATGYVLHVVSVDGIPLCLVKAGPAWKWR